jgi:hypothetical protein
VRPLALASVAGGAAAFPFPPNTILFSVLSAGLGLASEMGRGRHSLGRPAAALGAGVGPCSSSGRRLCLRAARERERGGARALAASVAWASSWSVLCARLACVRVARRSNESRRLRWVTPPSPAALRSARQAPAAPPLAHSESRLWGQLRSERAAAERRAHSAFSLLRDSCSATGLPRQPRASRRRRRRPGTALATDICRGERIAARASGATAAQKHGWRKGRARPAVQGAHARR